jgi:hypothetical protein
VSDITWKPTRLEAENKSRLTRATVEETPSGWTWSVYRGTALVDSGGYFYRLSKNEAIAEASDVMRGKVRS